MSANCTPEAVDEVVAWLPAVVVVVAPVKTVVEGQSWQQYSRQHHPRHQSRQHSVGSGQFVVAAACVVVVVAVVVPGQSGTAHNSHSKSLILLLILPEVSVASLSVRSVLVCSHLE